MSNFKVPPTTYKEWLNDFEACLKSWPTKEDSDILMQGRLENDPYIINVFQNQLVSFLAEAIRQRLIRFQRDFNFMSEINDFIGMEMYLTRLKADLLNLRFYMYLKFIRLEAIKHISNDICLSLANYFKDLSFSIEINFKGSQECVNVLYIIKKLEFSKIFEVSE